MRYNYSLRFFLPFYFLYLYFIFEFLVNIFRLLFNSNNFKILFLFILILFLFNIPKLFTSDGLYSGFSSSKGRMTEYINLFVSKETPLGSKVYISQNKGELYYFGEKGIDLDHDFFYLSEIDSIFKFKLVKDIALADYLLYNEKNISNKSKFDLFVKDNTSYGLNLVLYKLKKTE